MNAEEEELTQSKELAKTGQFFQNQYPKAFNGGTWDAKHMTSFLSRSNYSNWRGNSPNISRMSDLSAHARSYSTTKGDHFFRTTKEDKNQSKIGFTTVFPLVSNSPLMPAK